MKTRNFTLLFNLVLLFAIVLSGCGSAATATEAAVPATEAVATDAATDAPVAVEPGTIAFPAEIAGGRPVEISVVGIPTEANPTGLADWNAAVARFQAKYPNVTVTGNDYVYAPDTFPALVAGDQ